MEYVIAFQLLCGCFAGYVASQKHRNWFWWFLVGTLVPVAGVLIALTVEDARTAERGRGPRRASEETQQPKRPKRCCGRYIPDCQGCPYFSRPLFDPSFDKETEKKGYCRFFKKDLVQREEKEKQHVFIRDEQ
jgi:hypothetical protein